MRSLISDRAWYFNPPSPASINHIKNKLGCSNSFAQVLATRSKSDPHLSRILLQSDLSHLHSPHKLAGIKSAIDRLRKARSRGEKLFIHGDFDVDGVTSTSLLYLTLKEIGFKDIKVEVSNRALGHGLNDRVVGRIINENFDLLITADCGINNFEEIRTLQANDVDVIITDHHSLPEKLPPAAAILNPKLDYSSYPNKHLAGVGVAFKLITGLMQNLGLTNSKYEKYLDLVMLGTVADLVPLIYGGEVENKILVSQGLRNLARGVGNRGLKVLIKSLSLTLENLTAGRVSYIVAPHLNAANRVGDPRVAFLLLTTKNVKRLRYLADILIDYNQDRQRGQEELKFQADESIRSGSFDLDRDKIIILEGEGWNPGLIGLIASQIVEEYLLPTILISKKSRISQASARSVPEFNLVKCLKRHRHLFIQYGGHEMAAGFKIKNEDLPALRREMNQYANQKLADFTPTPSKVDARASSENIDANLYQEICKLSPFGMGNPKPRFITDKMLIEGVRQVGNQNKHLKFKAQIDDSYFEVIGYGWGEYAQKIGSLNQAKLIFKLGINQWMGKRRVQLELEDLV